MLITCYRTTTSRITARITSIVSVVPAYVFHIAVSGYLITDIVMQRAGMKGTSFTYFTTDNARQARELLNILREAKAEIPSQLEEMAQVGGGGGGGT